MEAKFRLNSAAASILACASLLLLAACGGGTRVASPADLRADGGIDLVIWEETYLEGGAADTFKLTQQASGDQLDVQISVEGASNLKALICELRYDPQALDPLDVEKTGELDSSGGYVIDKALALDVEPGCIYYGQMLPRPQQRDGLYGNATLAVARFALRPDHAAKVTTSVPTNRRSQSHLSWDPESSELSWYYYFSGDFNQSGAVEISDLTPLGVHWKEASGGGPWPESDALSVIDYDSTGEINGADIEALSRYVGIGVITGYRIYRSDSLDDYPTANDAPNGPGAELIDTVSFYEALGDRATERLRFYFTVDEPQAGEYYWVRPVDGAGAEGTPSTLVGGPAE